MPTSNNFSAVIVGGSFCSENVAQKAGYSSLLANGLIEFASMAGIMNSGRRFLISDNFCDLVGISTKSGCLVA